MESQFSHGYHHFHPNRSLNFQMNRWVSYLGDRMIADMARAAPKIQSFDDWKREFLALAQEAEAAGDPARAAYHYRSADFFMMDDPRRPETRQKFLHLIREAYHVTADEQIRIPYGDRYLHALHFRTAQPRDILVVHGGFDSYIEEFLPILRAIQSAGYEVIAFEGPGQGSSLEEQGLTMIPEWERPTAAVLDHLHLADVTLVGISLGGNLAIRAAAFEPRVRRVVAWNALTDAFGATLKTGSPGRKALLRLLLHPALAPLLDGLLRQKMRSNPALDWLIRHGNHVLGTRTPSERFRVTLRYNTVPISHLINQDVLVLGSSDDFGVPKDQFYEQVRLLTNARSVTARLFTQAEEAQEHCGIGNLNLVLQVVISWLDLLAERDRQTQSA